MSDDRDSGAAVFELTVLGGLAPSLEAALTPSVCLGLRATTVVRVRRSHLDLVETYGQLVQGGFEVADITRVDGAPSSAVPASQCERSVRDDQSRSRAVGSTA